MDTLKRREFVQKAVLAGAGLALGPAVTGRPANHMDAELSTWDIHFFSKHLQFLDYQGAAEACAEAGFNGADLTVRPGGHVLPENVERDLPLAVKAFTEAGLKIDMMTTGITDPEDPLTDIVLRTASDLGIRYYRLGYYHYDPGLSVVNNLERIRVKMQGLALLNEKYRIHGAYQNHAGNYFGAPVWDLWEVIRDMDPEWTGCQYDVRHATVEGNRSWPLGMKLLKDHIRCMVIKDFTWGVEDGSAREINVPVGEGVVDFEACFRLVSELGIHGPITMHLEYEMFPEKEMTVDQMKDHAVRLMKKDLQALREYL
jgi:L-ribulose-5-phosphate 3-epimerase